MAASSSVEQIRVGLYIINRACTTRKHPKKVCPHVSDSARKPRPTTTRCSTRNGPTIRQRVPSCMRDELVIQGLTVGHHTTRARQHTRDSAQARSDKESLAHHKTSSGREKRRSSSNTASRGSSAGNQPCATEELTVTLRKRVSARNPPRNRLTTRARARKSDSLHHSL